MQTVDYMWFRYDSMTGLANMKTVNSCIWAPTSQSSPPSKGKRKSRCRRHWLPFPGSLIHRDPYTSPLLPKTESSHQDQHPCFFPSSTYQITSSPAHLTLCAHSGTGQKNEVQHMVWGLWKGMQQGVDNRKGRALQSALSTSPCPVCHLPGLQISLQWMIYSWFALSVCLGQGFSI